MKKNRHIRNIFFMAGSLLVSLQAAHAQDCSISVAVTATKHSYTQDELLAVNVSFSNQGTPESLRLSYPTLQYPTGVVLSFTPKGGLVQSAELPRAQGGLNAPQLLPAGRTLTTQIYLQRFLDGFQPGQYELPWDITVPCLGKAKVVTARGLLSFDITSALSSGLQSEYAGFLSRAETIDMDALRTRSGDPDVFVERVFRVEEAIEALRLAKSPLVIPYLEQLAVNRDFVLKNNAFEGLIKFPTNAEARGFVFQSLQSLDSQQITQGLRVLTAWNERLPEIEVRSLLIKNDPSLQVAVLRYLGQSHNSGYTELLEEYSKHANTAVAAQAKSAASQLKR